MRPLATSWPPERRSATATGAAQRFSHTSTRGRRAGLQRGGGLFEVVLAEQAGRRALELGEARAVGASSARSIAATEPSVVLDDERDVEDADDAAVDQVQIRAAYLAGDRLLARPLEHDVVDRAHDFSELLFAHGVSFAPCGRRPPGGPTRAGVVSDRRAPRGSAGATGACRSTRRCERRASRVRTSLGPAMDVGAVIGPIMAPGRVRPGSPTWGDAASPTAAKRWSACRAMTSA